MTDYEKLGWFYLGRPVDPGTQESRPEPLLYDSRDLLTHAVIVGMTGSGKTGLGVGLLEEAAMDGVPALVIDPKGDLANLALRFPGLSAEELRPWVSEEDARRKSRTPEEHAEAEAAKWREGLAAWDQSGARIRKLADQAPVRVFTPGSSIGDPISIRSALEAPSAALREDPDLFRGRIETAVTSLLSFAGIEADPLRSREHILLSTLLSEGWTAGRDFDLEGLIASLQDPPIAKVGVMDLETFYPADDRFELAMRINNLLAAPGFEAWMRGTPMDLDRLLYGDHGRPRLAVVSLAHLSDPERMFFVSLLLSEIVGWMRTKPGTSSLRALLYMDEVFGFFPPVAEPPSKRPMLTLLKQARAYGLGVVLATQNPADLDYKALSNIGTWFLGRLQTARDKARVLDGLQGAGSGGPLDRSEVDELLSGLRSRVFLMRNVHEEDPVLLETRWVLSYLAGPLDRSALGRLMASELVDRMPEARSTEDAGSTARGSGADRPSGEDGVSAPHLPLEIPQVFLSGGRDRGGPYRPALLGQGRAFVEDPKKGVSERLDWALLAPMGEAGGIDWLEAEALELDESALADEPAAGRGFARLPARAQKKESYSKWSRDLATAIWRRSEVTLFRSARPELLSRPGESERDFRIRHSEAAREARDAEVDEVRERHGKRIERLEERIRKAEARLEVEQQQAQGQTLSSVLAGAATVAGMLFGRRKVSATSIGRLGTAVRSIGRTRKESGDVERAGETVEALREELRALEAELEEKLAEVTERFDPLAFELESVTVKPRKSDVEVRRVVLAWVPAEG